MVPTSALVENGHGNPGDVDRSKTEPASEAKPKSVGGIKVQVPQTPSREESCGAILVPLTAITAPTRGIQSLTGLQRPANATASSMNFASCAFIGVFSPESLDSERQISGGGRRSLNIGPDQLTSFDDADVQGMIGKLRLLIEADLRVVPCDVPGRVSGRRRSACEHAIQPGSQPLRPGFEKHVEFLQIRGQIT
jgi:hypothetical protein